MNYQNLVSVLSAEAEQAEADNTDLGFDNSWYHAQPHPIIFQYLIVYLRTYVGDMHKLEFFIKADFIWDIRVSNSNWLSITMISKKKNNSRLLLFQSEVKTRTNRDLLESQRLRQTANGKDYFWFSVLFL